MQRARNAQSTKLRPRAHATLASASQGYTEPSVMCAKRARGCAHARTQRSQAPAKQEVLSRV
eukprot:4354029-Pleurochrysis_carterae.AAC.1